MDGQIQTTTTSSNRPLSRLRFKIAAVFNFFFTILVTITLLGIIFITRPNNTMHNVPPTWWIPISCIFIPGLAAVQLFTWRTLRINNILSPIEIALSHRQQSGVAKYVFGVFWLLNYCIVFIILISLYKPDPKRGFEVGDFLLATLIGSFINTTANIFLLLIARMILDEDWFRLAIWKGRHLFTIAVAVVAIVYYYVIS